MAFLELQLDLCFWFSTLSSLSLNHFPPNHPSFPPLINNNSPHTPHEHARNAVNDNTLALLLFTTPHHHFTRPFPSITLTTPLVLTAHSRCPTTVHDATNGTTQTPLVLQLTHNISSLSTLIFLIHCLCVALSVLQSIALSTTYKYTCGAVAKRHEKAHHKRATRET